jgi:hypothetical protein
VEKCLKKKCQENVVQYLCSVASVADNHPSNAKVCSAMLRDVHCTEHRDLNSGTY